MLQTKVHMLQNPFNLEQPSRLLVRRVFSVMCLRQPGRKHVVQSAETLNCRCSVAQSCLALCDPMDCSTPGFPVHHHLLEFSQTHVPWVGDTIQPSHSLSSPSPPAFNISQPQGLFHWVSSLHQVPKNWSFSFSVSPSNEYSELIFFRIDWFDLLAVQGTLKSLLQHHNS